MGRGFKETGFSCSPRLIFRVVVFGGVGVTTEEQREAAKENALCNFLAASRLGFCLS